MDSSPHRIALALLLMVSCVVVTSGQDKPPAPPIEPNVVEPGPKAPQPSHLPVFSQVQLDVRLLSAAALSRDAPALLRFFRDRTRGGENPGKIRTLVEQLGDPDFILREKASADLLALGPPAIPFLRDAVRDADKERARRARTCLAKLTAFREPIVAEAAVRALVRTVHPDAATTLLRYLPYAPDEGVRQAIHTALQHSLLRDGKPDDAVIQAVTDPEPARRAAAAYLLGLTKSNRQCLTRLVADPSPLVRVEAARALLLGGDRSGLSVLLGLLEKAPLPVAWRAEGALHAAAGADAPSRPLFDPPEYRRPCRAAWAAYWKDHPGAIKVRPPDFGPAGAVRILLCDLDEGIIHVLDRSFKEQWRIKGCRGPVAVQVLSNGHLLVTENHGQRITERDRWGHILWEHKVPEPPLTAWRLPNGNTGIVTRKHAFEITPDGKRVWSFERESTFPLHGGWRLREGRVNLWIQYGDLLVLSPTGKVEDRIEKAIWLWREQEPRTYFADGKPLYLSFAVTGVRACSLPDGHILSCNEEKRVLEELDATRRVLRQFKTPGRPWHVQVLP